jgi:DNA-binding CsgD family transcriptional regulator
MAKKEATTHDLLVQMKLTNRLLAAPLKQTMGQKELVRLLASTGASAQDIADVLDTTAGTVATTLQRIKKGGGKRADAE